MLRFGPCPAGGGPSVELAALLVARGGIQRGSASGADAELAAALVSAGRHDVLAAPLVRDGQAVGALVPYARTGFGADAEGELAVMAAPAEIDGRGHEASALIGVKAHERRKRDR